MTEAASGGTADRNRENKWSGERRSGANEGGEIPRDKCERCKKTIKAEERRGAKKDGQP